MRYRVACVLAPVGWGKTAAVRGAIDGIAHRWYDLSIQTAGFDPAAAPATGEVVVVDGVHTLDAGARRALVETIRTNPQTRWVLLARHRADLPVSTWIATGDAGSPVFFEDLALSAAQIGAAIENLGPGGDAIARTVFEGTGGWPVALRFALSSLESSADLSRAAASTRRLLFEYIASELFDEIPLERRHCLHALAMSGTADASLLAELGCAENAEDIAWLRAGWVPAVETAKGFSLHPVFAQFLRSRLDSKAAEALARRAATALRSRDRIPEAFELIQTYAPDAALDELRTGGFALLDAGCWEQVESAIRALPQTVRRDDAIVVGLRAQIEAQSGALTRANDLYQQAFSIATTPALRAAISRRRALHLLNQGDLSALEAIVPALDEGSDIERADAHGVHAMALALAGSTDDARAEIAGVLQAAKIADDDPLLARTLYRASYVEYQGGALTAAEVHANEAARLAQRIDAWFHFICAHSILHAISASRDDHAASLWHAQQIGNAAQRTGDRRHRLYALSAQYILEVERGRGERAEAIEAEMPVHSSGFRDELELYIALAIRKSWDRAFSEGYRLLAALDDRIADPSERRLWNAALAMFATFGSDERNAARHLRACGKHAAALARENAIGNAQAECYAGVAHILLGHPEAALRRVPHRAPTTQTRALSSFVRELAELGASLDSDSAAPALSRLRSAGQEGFAHAISAALAARRRDGGELRLTAAERRVLAHVALGTPAEAIAREHGRSIHTVRNQIKAAIRKLGASGSIEAVARAKRLGLID
jgi:ATP/maltotriose-dependent transcriptional regulator MalT